MGCADAVAAMAAQGAGLQRVGTLEAIADNLSDLSGRDVCDGFALTPATFQRGRGVFRKGYYGVRKHLRHPSTGWVAIAATATSAAAPN
jgi:hypothetical protein